MSSLTSLSHWGDGKDPLGDKGAHNVQVLRLFSVIGWPKKLLKVFLLKYLQVLIVQGYLLFYQQHAWPLPAIYPLSASLTLISKRKKLFLSSFPKYVPKEKHSDSSFNMRHLVSGICSKIKESMKKIGRKNIPAFIITSHRNASHRAA